MSKAVALLAAAKRRREEGNTAEAERLYRQILVEAPGHAGASRELGSMLLDSHRLTDAVAVLSGAAAARPNDAELHVLLGRGLFMTGQVPAATQALESALKSDPTLPAGRLWLAKCRLAAGRGADAEGLLRPLMGSRPTDPLVLAAMGHACIGQGRWTEAISHFRGATELNPSASTYSDLGYSLYVSEKFDDALTAFDTALARDPRWVAAVGGKAMILADRNARDEARRIIQDALDAGLLDTVLATTYARLSTKPEQRADAVRVIEAAMARPGLTSSERSGLFMALGTLKEAAGDYDGAFEGYKAGNDLIVSGFDEGALQRSLRESLAVFDRTNLARLPRAASTDPLPVFIVGMPRSGTSLVEQILASHPSVHGAGELGDLAALAHSMPRLLNQPGAAYPRCVLSLTQEHVDQLARRHVDRLRQLGGAALRVTDKMPLNFVHLGIIDILFPGARVIHCMRHPLDTCLSCYTTAMHVSHGYRTRLKDLAAVYRMYREVVDHMRPILRVPILDVQYEDLVANPEPHTRRLVEFVGLPWDERCLKFHENRRVVRTASNDQVRRPIYNSSVGRWKHFERHLGDLIQGLNQYCPKGG